MIDDGYGTMERAVSLKTSDRGNVKGEGRGLCEPRRSWQDDQNAAAVDFDNQQAGWTG